MYEIEYRATDITKINNNIIQQLIGINIPPMKHRHCKGSATVTDATRH